MRTQDKLKINIPVGTEKITLLINREQEQFYRDAAANLKSKLEKLEADSRPAKEKSLPCFILKFSNVRFATKSGFRKRD